MKTKIGIWSGGVRVRANSCDQSIKQDDDYVESEIFFESVAITGTYFYMNFKMEMSILDELSKILYGRIMGYCKELKMEGDPIAKKASELFWQLCERKFQDLVRACGIKDNGKEAEKMRSYFLQYVRDVYETSCPRDTARQLEAWAKQYPNLSRYTAAKEKTASD
jgi:CRISPR system Cascade subunit CasA